MLALNPARAASAIPRAGRSRRTVGGLAAAGGAIAGLAVCAAAAAGGPLLDALDVSAPSFRIAAGIVAALAGASDLFRRPPSPEPAPAGRRAALIPVAVPAVARPALLVLAVGAGADRGVLVSAGTIATGIALLTTLAVACPTAGPGGRASGGRVAALPRDSSPAGSCSPSTATWTSDAPATGGAPTRSGTAGTMSAERRGRWESARLPGGALPAAGAGTLRSPTEGAAVPPLATSTFLQVLLASMIVIPVVILWVAAVVDMFSHGGSGLKIAAMLVLILIVPILGPLLYFVFARREPASAEAAHMAAEDQRREAARRPAGGTGIHG